MSWIEPSSNNILSQGTIVDNVEWGLNPNPLGVVLSNACDLEWDKASFILIACLIPAGETIQLSKEFIDKRGDVLSDNTISRSRWETLTKYLTGYIHNVNINRYFFVDPTKVIDCPYLLVDFQKLLTIPVEQKESLMIVGNVPSPHKEKMIMHFASYVSRIGVDRVDQDQTALISTSMLNPLHT